MGCLLCNIMAGMVKTPIAAGEQEEFLDQLAYDIAVGYPEVVQKINEYVAKLYLGEGGKGNGKDNRV